VETAWDTRRARVRHGIRARRTRPRTSSGHGGALLGASDGLRMVERQRLEPKTAAGVRAASDNSERSMRLCPAVHEALPRNRHLLPNLDLSRNQCLRGHRRSMCFPRPSHSMGGRSLRRKTQ
jgi:hypothetical protein